MSQFFILVFSVLIIQRLAELQLAKKNTKQICEQGGYEVGATHYKFMIFIHFGFFASLLTEVLLGNQTIPSYWIIPFLFFLLAQAFRYWCITSLGTFWNTRIYILPGSSPIQKGPYRLLKHPNYFAVLVEFISFPLIFGAYQTAIVWTLINFIFLRFVRIPTEEQALQTECRQEAP